jgi:uncharacterized protein involved in type VI secretion and phage assembly
MDTRTEDLLLDVAEGVRQRYWGKYRGTVEDPNDSDNLGRIIVKVPSVYGTLNSPPALPAVPFAGPNYGFLMLPRRGDLVWVEFENGLPAHPIWTGFCWSRNELPAPAAVDVRVLVTKENLKLVLDDAAKKLQLLHPGGGEITMTDSGITIKMGTSAKIELTSSGVAINGMAFKVS